MEFFELKYKNDEICSRIQEKPINLICFFSPSTRAVNADLFTNYGCTVNKHLITHNVNEDTIIVQNNDNTSKYHIPYETEKFLNTIEKHIDLIIDITNIELRFLGILLYHIKKKRFKTVICLYITPEKYNKKFSDTPSMDDNEERIGELFDLYNNMGVSRGINGYLIENDRNLTEKHIMLLGFEGGRTNRLCELADIHSFLPVITLPAFHPGWQNYALVANGSVLKKIATKNNLEYVAADSVLSVYAKMQKWNEAYSREHFLRISPLGTKINALGMFLYILNHPRSFDILYDNPLETKSNTDGSRDYIYFDITEILYESES